MKRKSILAAIAFCTIAVSANAKNNDQNKLADHNFYGTTVSFHSKVSASAGSLSIAGPNGFSASKASKYGVPSIQLVNFGYVADGIYNYQLVIKKGNPVRLIDNGTNGRDPDTPQYGVKGTLQSGHFYVKDGQIVIPSRATEASQR